jgi:hypothetical protein
MDRQDASAIDLLPAVHLPNRNRPGFEAANGGIDQNHVIMSCPGIE